MDKCVGEKTGEVSWIQGRVMVEEGGTKASSLPFFGVVLF